VNDEEGDRMERAARTAGELLSLALGASEGDLARALEEVRRDDALDVLGAVLRQLAGLTATQQLRDLEVAAEEDVAGDDGSEAVSDDELPPDPWASSGDAASNALEHAGALFEALVEQRTVADLLRAVGALDESEALAVVFERALAEMAERKRPSGRR
jgi:hypothetical protein